MFYVMREEIKIIIYDYAIGGSRWVQGTKKGKRRIRLSRVDTLNLTVSIPYVNAHRKLPNIFSFP